MKLVLVRHPQVTGGAGRCYGRLELLPSPETLDEAARMLAGHAGMPAFSSPALRCRQLAERLDPAAKVWQELHELDFGDWEGQRWERLPRASLTAWTADPWHFRPGGGENATMLRDRWREALRRWQSLRIEEALVISHAGVIRMALAEAGIIPASQRWSAKIPHATPLVLELGGVD